MPDIFWTGSSTKQTSRQGSMLLGVDAKVLLCTTVHGYLDFELATRLKDAGDRIHAEHGELWLFNDWSDMTGYETRCRTELTSWCRAMGPTLRELHLFTRSRVVRMGISVAAMFLPNLCAHDTREQFLYAFASAKDHLTVQDSRSVPPRLG